MYNGVLVSYNVELVSHNGVLVSYNAVLVSHNGVLVSYNGVQAQARNADADHESPGYCAV